jgi:hypothetical protein
MKIEFKKKTISRLTRFLLVMAIVWAVPTGATAAGKLKLSSHEFKVGTVKEGVTIKKTVMLENTGNAEIVIKNISTS